MISILRLRNHKSQMSSPRFTHVVFSGGGFAGMSYLGVVRYFQTENLMQSIRHVAGTSIGAVFACAMAIGIPVGCLEQAYKEISQDATEMFIDNTKLLTMFQKKGCHSVEGILKPLRAYMKDSWNMEDISFLELMKKTGKHLIVCTTCVETGEVVYFSAETHPDVSVMKAIQASASLPMLFVPVRIGDRHYVDGGVAQNHPVECFGTPIPTSLLAVKVSKRVSVNAKPYSDWTFTEYMLQMLNLYLFNADKEYTKCKYQLFMLDPPIEFFKIRIEKDGIWMDVSANQIDESVVYGYKMMSEWMTKNFSLNTE